MVPWDDKNHSGKGEKFFDEDMKEWYCNNCFSKFIEINQNLKYEETISKEYFIFKNQKNVEINFYKSKKINPIFIFEEDVIKIGECLLDIGKTYENLKDRTLKVTMKFGGTFIDVTAIHLKSGKSVKTTLTFE